MRDLVALLVEGHADALARIEHAISRETPEYARFDSPEKRRAWQAGIDRTLRLFEALAAERRELTGAEAEELRRIGRQRADDDFPLDAVANSVRVAVHVVQEAVPELRWELLRFGNGVTSLIVEGYTERRQELATTAERGRVQLLDDLLSGAVPDDVVLDRGRALGLELSGLLGLFLVPATATHALEAEMRALLPEALAGPRATGVLPHTAVVVPVADEVDWHRACRRIAERSGARTTAVLAVGPCAGRRELRERYEESVEVLHHVAVVADGGPLVRCRDVHLLHLVATASPAARRSAVRAVKEGLDALPSRTGEMVETLVALVDNDFGIKEAAEKLCRTPKTVRRYKCTIAGVTGLPFDGWKGPVAYAIFVTMHKLGSA
jgi:hypothetical protein